MSIFSISTFLYVTTYVISLLKITIWDYPNRIVDEICKRCEVEMQIEMMQW